MCRHREPFTSTAPTCSRWMKTAGHDCGVTVGGGDAAGLAAVIKDLRASPERLRDMGKRARAAFEREWDEPIALARWREVIAEVEKSGWK